VLLPALRHGGQAAWAGQVLRRARRVTWIAIVVLLATGLYNLSNLSLRMLTETQAGTLLALKIFLVIVALMLGAHRDFGLVSRLARELDGAHEGVRRFRAIAWIDRTMILLGVVALYLGLAISRGRL
jgi:uncharacterized membrane protein